MHSPLLPKYVSQSWVSFPHTRQVAWRVNGWGDSGDTAGSDGMDEGAEASDSPTGAC